jgi:hypothetical protein
MKNQKLVYLIETRPFRKKQRSIGNRYVKGGDGHDILYNNPNAPSTWQEL